MWTKKKIYYETVHFKIRSNMKTNSTLLSGGHPTMFQGESGALGSCLGTLAMKKVTHRRLLRMLMTRIRRLRAMRTLWTTLTSGTKSISPRA